MEKIKKRAIITGGTRGIGKAIVEELAKNNEHGFILSDIAFIYNSSHEKAKLIEEQFKDSGVDVKGYKANVASFEEVQNIVNDIVQDIGGVDILINNAGITRDNLLLRMTEKDFDEVIDVNLKSIFNFTKAVIKPMIKQRSGKIINITSVVGLIGNAGQANYAASKSGVIGFTKSMAKELASRNITVNAVAPGFIMTDMTEKLNEKQREELLKNIPLGRLGKTEDISKTVAFLCSNYSDYITGQVITVDGGMVM